MKKRSMKHRSHPARLGNRGRLCFCVYAAAVCAFCLPVSVFAAAGDPLTVVSNLSTFIFSLIRAIGLILLGWGVVQSEVLYADDLPVGQAVSHADCGDPVLHGLLGAEKDGGTGKNHDGGREEDESSAGGTVWGEGI